MKVAFQACFILAFLYLTPFHSNARISDQDSLIYVYYFNQIEHHETISLDSVLAYCDSIVNFASRKKHPEKAAEVLLLKTQYAIASNKLGLVKQSLDLVESYILKINNTVKKQSFNLSRRDLLNHYYWLIGKRKKALADIKLIIDDFESLTNHTKADSSNLSYFYLQRGQINDEEGNYETAINFYKKARDLSGVPTAYASYIAEAYANRKEFGIAKKTIKEVIEKILKRKNRDQGYNKNLLSANYRNLAKILMEEDQLDEALNNLQRSLKYIDKDNPAYSYSLLLKGKIYLKKKDFPNALYFINRGLDLKKKSLNQNKNIQYAAFYVSIGDVYIEKGNLTEALANFQIAMINLVEHFDATNIGQNPELSSLNNKKELLEVFKKKINALYLLHLQTQKRSTYTDMAYKTADKAIDLIDSIRLDYFSENDKQFLIAQSYPIYSKAISLAIDINKKEYAFRLAEKSRAVNLYEALKIIQAEIYAELDDKILTRKYELKSQIIECQNAALNLKNNEHGDPCFTLKKKYKALLNEMKENLQFKNALEEMSIASPEKIRNKALYSDQSLLEFFVGNQYIYAFYIDPESDEIINEKIPLTKELKYAIEHISDHIYMLEGAYVKEAFLIYDKLFAPFFKDNKLPESLVIVPDGILWNVPFSALIIEEVIPGRTKNFKEHKYLGIQVALSQWFSASSFVATRYSNKNMKWDIDFLGYAPSFRFDPLIHTEAEIKEIGARFSNAQLVAGDTATKAHFIKFAPKARIIHCATHGVMNEEKPEHSYIAFSNVLNNEGRFFKLGLIELHNSYLPSDMAVLSACQTGVGKILTGEGVMSIARGFRYAGVQSIITTLWNINEKSSVTLMKEFYLNLLEGKRKDRALQLTNLNYINTVENKYAHPKYWAAFTAIGEVNPVVIFNPTLFYIITLSVFLLLALFFYVKKQRNKQKEFKPVSLQ